MPWISSDSALTQTQMENNADMVISYFRDLAYDDRTISALLGNMQAESTINPGRNEVDGAGYGLIQWTPVSTLITEANNLGSSYYTDGDIQCAVINSEIIGNPSANHQWYSTSAFISNYYDSGATSDMIGLTGYEFAGNSGNHSVEWLTIAYMACRLRPSYDPDVNHISSRISFAETWADYVGTSTGGSSRPIPDWNVNAIIQWGAIAETLRRLRLKKRR